MSKPSSIEQALKASDDRPSGFDYMRLLLSMGVILAHSRLLVGSDASAGPEGTFASYTGNLSVFLVPMFFALSGFLVAGSLERSRTLPGFLALRTLRIAPALGVEIFLSALLLGPLLTAYTYADYFRDPLFYRYFLNLIGEVQYRLPGLFESNPTTLVNGQLWTVPYELLCYIVLSVIALTGMYRARGYLIIVVLALFYLGQVLNTVVRPNLEFNGAGGSTAIMCFVAGLALYRFREKIPYSGWLCLAAITFSYLTVLLPIIPNGMRFAALPIAYFTVYLGLLNPQRNVLLSGDYSYGIYLYGFPIQQAVVQLFPAFRTPYWNFLISVPIVVVIAVFSWWLIEKPALGKRHLIKAAEDRWKARAPVQTPETV